MANINQSQGYKLTLPASYVSPNFIYAISVTPSGSASLNTYDSHITPPATLPGAVATTGQRCLRDAFHDYRNRRARRSRNPGGNQYQ